MSFWLLQNLVWASAAMLLVLAVRRPVARWFGAGPAYALWLLPALRLVLPPLPLADAGLDPLLPPLEITLILGDASPATATAGSILGPVLLVGWLAGAASFLGWQWLTYRRFLNRLSLSARSLGGHEGLPLIESDFVEGPVALGLLDRRIVVPADFAQRYAPDERRLALDHELIHHRRGDIWWNLAALLLLALNWFNPIAWIAFRAFREDQELACDARVTATASHATRHDYARALIKSASRPGMVAACPLNHADQLKRRLKMMNSHRNSRARMLGGAFSLVMLAGVTTAFGSSGLAHPHPEGKEGERRQERVIIMEHKGDRAPGTAGAHGAHGAPGGRGEVRHFVMRRGEGGEIIAPEACNDGGQVADVNEETNGERTRIIICAQGNGEANAATRLERLQNVRSRMAGNADLSAEHRQRVLAAIDREIARLRAQ